MPSQEEFDDRTRDLVTLTRCRVLRWTPQGNDMVADFKAWKLHLAGDTLRIRRDNMHDGAYINWPASPYMSLLVSAVFDNSVSLSELEPFFQALKDASRRWLVRRK
jgi:hypothetical protein